MPAHWRSCKIITGMSLGKEYILFYNLSIFSWINIWGFPDRTVEIRVVI